ncbi:MAG: tRNA 2-thiouridine(34) synthase MnmA [Candidatus Desulfofervidaceae bacterium]|nr:tRNA 2-thiouridine(34) synthase MnmA [Candidatus Desulfofervidaceae bacterium]
MKKVAIALSGGIDSAVAAYLLKKEGYEVTGVFLRLVNSPPPYPPAEIARFLDIPYFELDLRNLFKKLIIDYFVNSYLEGKTPNPCVVCNQKIKFGVLLEEIKRRGFDYLATGHYVRKSFQNGRYLLLQGVDKEKEQSYFLFLLNQYQLANTLWPLGNFFKDEVKKIAISIELPNKNIKESQEICFIPQNDYRSFLVKRVPDKLKKTGKILDLSGKILGEHRGLWHYTIGQRRGIGVCGKEPYYVREIDTQHNCLIVAPRRELFFKQALLEELNFFPFAYLEEPLEVMVKIRYKHKASPALIEPVERNLVKVSFDPPQFGVTPGQAAVFYQGEVCIGGGLIKSAQ